MKELRQYLEIRHRRPRNDHFLLPPQARLAAVGSLGKDFGQMMQSNCQRPKVAISAASSFTGTWIARAFHEAGWTVLPVCSQPLAAYRGVRLARIQLVQEYVPVHFGCEAADGRLAAWIRKHQPQIWIQHHHFMESFRSPDYDLHQA